MGERLLSSGSVLGRNGIFQVFVSVYGECGISCVRVMFKKNRLFCKSTRTVYMCTKKFLLEMGGGAVWLCVMKCTTCLWRGCICVRDSML